MDAAEDDGDDDAGVTAIARCYFVTDELKMTWAALNDRDVLLETPDPYS